MSPNPQRAQDMPRLAHLQPGEIETLFGADLYFGSFNDGYDFHDRGHRVEKPYWFAFYEAKRVGFAHPRRYAHGFCDGYRCDEDQQAHPERWEDTHSHGPA